ncbi:MAG: glycosyltransferase family 9 protein [Planctomycetes bacterium]|nr:glycosyltransferase family 9 protein [Planctomycetota bacterium]
MSVSESFAKRHYPFRRINLPDLHAIDYEIIFAEKSVLSERAVEFIETRLRAVNDIALDRQLKQMGIEAVDAQPRIHIGGDVQGLADEALPAADGAAPVAVHPGSGGRHKCWPLESYVALIRELNARQVPVVILFGPAEIEIETALGPLAIDGATLVRPPGLWELASVLARSSLFIGNDSGPGHLAAAVGTPTLSLFGPTDPQRWCPVGPRCRVLRAPGGSLEALRGDVVLSAALEELGLG